ncbi:MAG: signal recognition particle-docking protein FtsY [Methanobrevibacter sp.]|uniref:signal recognition particle-docking protein FtsY n=1 Tax=Methanobrevibacter sp. TaxID=66852 RepID=UPI002E7914B7|nr:signal recognition particle-docking protein FtsY [Methanobrevibacter sp.]MEE0935517.1 signal recognition particle-docking protein FtsY [Methanobrevibacter sp.]
MFESLKKKFSRTSEKLEEELIEEAEQEDNLKEEKGTRFSFFSFGRKKEEEKEETEEDDSNLLPEAEEDVAETPEEVEEVEEEADEAPEEVEEDLESEDDEEEISDDEAEEVKEEKKPGLLSRLRGQSKQDESEEESEDEEEPESEEEEKEEKSHFWSRKKDEDETSDEEEEPESEEEEKEEKSHFWSRNKDKSDISADGEATGGIFSFVREKTIQEKHVEDILFELEMELLQGDVAMEVASEVVDGVKDNLVGKKIKRSNDITELTFNALRDTVAEIIDVPGKSMTEMIEEKKAQGEPLVVMFVGINGTGKTTTIGKLANYYLNKGYTPVIAASDTFRAGAIEQVTHHADNVGVKIIKHQKGSDPAAVAFDAVEHAKAQGKELVLIDTAGRMQTNTNLMDEMKKIKRVSKPDLVIFVGDALTGNDATEQAKKFNEAIDIDGVILTKADADSKGGASLSIGYVIQKPIMFLGVGQGYDDIMEYDAEWMLNQLFSEDEEAVELAD